MWEHIIGHTEQKKFLQNYLQAKERPHALLFSGAAGLGKRTLALEFAKALLCFQHNGTDGCEACRLMNLQDGNLSHPDFVLVQHEWDDKKDRLRVCFDTCHVNDAGYDLVHDYEGVFRKFDEVIGLDQIAVFHVNDSLNPLEAHKDRHANIGKGTIGYDTLHRLVHDERFSDIPKILETPWLCAEGEKKKTIPPYKEEIAWLLE